MPAVGIGLAQVGEERRQEHSVELARAHGIAFGPRIRWRTGEFLNRGQCSQPPAPVRALAAVQQSIREDAGPVQHGTRFLQGVDHGIESRPGIARWIGVEHRVAQLGQRRPGTESRTGGQDAQHQVAELHLPELRVPAA